MTEAEELQAQRREEYTYANGVSISIGTLLRQSTDQWLEARNDPFLTQEEIDILADDARRWLKKYKHANVKRREARLLLRVADDAVAVERAPDVNMTDDRIWSLYRAQGGGPGRNYDHVPMDWERFGKTLGVDKVQAYQVVEAVRARRKAGTSDSLPAIKKAKSKKARTKRHGKAKGKNR